MAALSYFCRKNLFYSFLRSNNTVTYRLLSTSDKKKEVNDGCDTSDSLYKRPPDFSKPLENKNWVSYGFDPTSEEKDRYYTHATFFSFITVFFCGFSFLYAYFPDRKQRDWAMREAFIRLYEREKLGLDPIDPNYIDPEKMELPPDEDLTDEDIII